MTILLAIIIVFLVLVIIALAVVFYYMRKGLRFVKRMTNGHQQTRHTRHTSRTTRTADGLTIVDNRSPEKKNKKIFAHDEGEYVDFKESD